MCHCPVKKKNHCPVLKICTLVLQSYITMEARVLQDIDMDLKYGIIDKDQVLILQNAKKNLFAWLFTSFKVMFINAT